MSSPLCFLSSLSPPFHHRGSIFCYLPTAPTLPPSPTKLGIRTRKKRRRKKEEAIRYRSWRWVHSRRRKETLPALPLYHYCCSSCMPFHSKLRVFSLFFIPKKKKNKDFNVKKNIVSCFSLGELKHHGPICLLQINKNLILWLLQHSSCLEDVLFLYVDFSLVLKSN